jgi:hypothetical protein
MRDRGISSANPFEEGERERGSQKALATSGRGLLRRRRPLPKIQHYLWDFPRSHIRYAAKVHIPAYSAEASFMRSLSTIVPV